MRISFDGIQPSKADMATTAYRATEVRTEKGIGAYALDISGAVTDNAAYGSQGWGESLARDMDEVMQLAGEANFANYRNYMAVMSNSLSPEDFAKLNEEGINPADTDIETTVTIVDTIKAQLLKAGVSVPGFTDTLDAKQLEAITGSAALAQQMQAAFALEQLPLTEENADAAMEAYLRGIEVTQLSEGTLKYLVGFIAQNGSGLKVTIDDLYMAQHAGAMDADRQARGYFAAGAGYLAKKADAADVSGLDAQIGALIESAGYEADDRTKADARWLVEKGVPLTKETFTALEQLKELTLPAEPSRILEAAAGALAEGKSAGEGTLNDPRSTRRKAAETLAAYEKRYETVCGEAPTEANVKARLQLEEVRLHMTVEANIKLLKSGFAVDTAPIEDTIDALKALEERLHSLEEKFGRDGEAEITSRAGDDTESVDKGTGTYHLSAYESVSLMRTTMTLVSEVPRMPAAALAKALFTDGNASAQKPVTLETLHIAGKEIEQQFKLAGERYETMMTAPRSDLGDSIKTAFRNVDSILSGMGQELTDENRKAVRSLSYNRIEVTEEKLMAVKGADHVVQRVVEKMTPAAVLKMIRDGVNPLHTSMEELEEKLDSYDTFGQDSEKYSRFLYRLEQSGNISEAEKESFIGIYRLLRQIEKTDGAAIGKLVDTGAQINFENLLSAVRTGKVRGINVSVDADFGGLTELNARGISIDAQIDAAYNEQIVRDAKAAAELGTDGAEELHKAQEPVTIENLLALKGLKENIGAPFTRKKKNESAALKKAETEAPKGLAGDEGPAQALPESAFQSRETLRIAYGNLVDAEMDRIRMDTFEEAEGSLDVKAMQLAYKQLSILNSKAITEEEYDIPAEIDGTLTGIHLKLVHDGEDSGKVSVNMELPELGILSAQFSVSEGKVSGFFAGDRREAVEYLHKAADIFNGKLESAGIPHEKAQVVQGKTKELPANAGDETIETKDLYRIAGMVIAAMNGGTL